MFKSSSAILCTDALVSSPVLVQPQFHSEHLFIVETDATAKGLGAVLAQQQSDGQVLPTAFASRSLTVHEHNYTIRELDTLGMVWALKVLNMLEGTTTKLNTSGYHPQCDGLVEKFTFTNILSKTVSKDGHDWDQHLPKLLFVHQVAVQESMQMSHFYLLYSRY